MAHYAELWAHSNTLGVRGAIYQKNKSKRERRKSNGPL